MQIKYSFVADESVDYNLIKFLRQRNILIYSIQEQSPSLKDNQVLILTVNNNAVLITEDKDFGELVFKLQLPHTGIFINKNREYVY